MSAIAEMSRAIRTTIERYAPTLKELDDETLSDFALITNAFAMDIRDEYDRRRDSNQDTRSTE